MAIMRSRCLPIASFESLIKTGDRIGISYGNLGTVHGQMSSLCKPVGSIFVEPDLQSLRPMQDMGPIKQSATVMARFTDEKGEGLSLCPRANLGRIVSRFQKEHHIDFLVGFEIEITFCRRNSTDSEEPFSPLDIHHDWGTFTDEQYLNSMTLMMSITSALREIGIEVQQIHSEAGVAQYEFVLPPLPAVEAVDALIQARQCIQQIAATHNLRATCHPLPFPGVGTAAHAHISLNSSQLSLSDAEAAEMSFMASVLTHLSAICATTMPQAVSYDRVVDDSWTGGTSIAWGTENREVPLRRVGSWRWEVRCLDGTANMYLALYAILSAGLDGVNRSSPMEMKDCTSNPSKLSDQEKQELGITRKLPKSIDEAIDAFEKDTDFTEFFGSDLAHQFLTMKKFEQEMVKKMSEKDKRVWLIERY